MKELGKFFVLAGVLLTLLGGWIWKNDGLGFLSRLGRLPGDFHFQKGGFSIQFPLTSCLLLSAVLSLILWLIRR